MAKRRERPVENPLSADLIADAVAPVEALQRPAPPVTSPRRLEARARQRKSGEFRDTAQSSTTGSKNTSGSFPKYRLQRERGRYRSSSKTYGGSKVTESDITRALWSLVRRAESAMIGLKAKAPKMVRPANGDWVGKAEYDDEIARFLHLAIKKMGVGD